MPKILLAHLSFCPESFYLAKGNGKRLNAYSLRLYILIGGFFLGSLNPFMDRFQMPYIPPQFTTYSGLHIFIKLFVVFVGDPRSQIQFVVIHKLWYPKHLLPWRYTYIVASFRSWNLSNYRAQERSYLQDNVTATCAFTSHVRYGIISCSVLSRVIISG